MQFSWLGFFYFLSPNTVKFIKYIHCLYDKIIKYFQMFSRLCKSADVERWLSRHANLRNVIFSNITIFLRINFQILELIISAVLLVMFRVIFVQPCLNVKSEKKTLYTRIICCSVYCRILQDGSIQNIVATLK